MPCDEILLHAYFDQELAAAEAAGVEEHLKGCTQCQTLLGELQWLQQALGPTQPAAAPVSRISQAKLDCQPSQKMRDRNSWHQLRTLGLALAASLVMVVGGTHLVKPELHPSPSSVPGTYSVQLPSGQYEVSVQGGQLLEVEIRDDQEVGRLDASSKKSL